MPFFELHDASQGSTEWLNARLGRITASKVGEIMGVNPFAANPEKTALDIVYGIPCAINPAMAFGSLAESRIREIYTKATGIKVKELGLAVWTPDNRFGASVDGYIVDCGEIGIIEIKTTSSSYVACPPRSTPRDMPYPNITQSHFEQINFAGSIVDATFCDYVIYYDGKITINRMPISRDYFYNIQLPACEIFWAKYVEPMIRVKGISNECRPQ